MCKFHTTRSYTDAEFEEIFPLWRLPHREMALLPCEQIRHPRSCPETLTQRLIAPQHHARAHSFSCRGLQCTSDQVHDSISRTCRSPFKYDRLF
jgi:hypothetical protein